MRSILNSKSCVKIYFHFLTKTMFFLIFIISVTYSQEKSFTQLNPLSSQYRFSINGGITYTKTDFRLSEIDYLLRGDLEYLFETSSDLIIGTKIIAASGFLAGKGESASKLSQIESFRTSVWYLGIGVSLNYLISEFFIPFVSTGVAYFNYRPSLKNIYGIETDVNNNSSSNNVMLYGEGGFFMMISKKFGFSAMAGINYVPVDDLDGVTNKISNGKSDDIFFSGLLGINLFIGGTKDSDGDGVTDKLDACPHTPAGVVVDQFGCAIDSDQDGIPDYIDLCDNTQRNIRVDSSGCPIDSDKDGVADYLDLCPDTPIGTEVDEVGCKKISDSTLIPEKYIFILPSDSSFTEDFSLLPFAQMELNEIINIMKEYSETKWRIESYTDNVGQYESNIDLSVKRAKAVYDYIVSAGIKRDRLSFFGHGSDYPVANNSNDAGRVRNRRITILLDLNPEPEIKPTEINVNLNYNYALEKYIGDMIYSDGVIYCVQVSFWRNEKIADEEARSLLVKGFDSFIAIVELPDHSEIWYRVRVGYFSSLEEARRIRELIMK